ncbi:MAG TPA: hypothetical protein VGK40_00025 [Verrucomicrobiae bacterium]|jgi:imidazolonepropionase-like amidohydrolase
MKTATGTTLVANGQLIDGTGAPPVPAAALVIENGRIQFAGPAAQAPDVPAHAQRIDARGGTIMPGLVEAHFHATYFNIAALEDLDFIEKMSVERGPEFGLSQRVIDGHQETLEGGAESARRILRAGGRLGMGGDYGFGWNPHGDYAKELIFFVKDVGLTPLEVITTRRLNAAARSASSNARGRPNVLAGRRAAAGVSSNGLKFSACSRTPTPPCAARPSWSVSIIRHRTAPPLCAKRRLGPWPCLDPASENVGPR